MKNYFIKDYYGKDDSDIIVFLKRKYDKADEIYDRRFSEKQGNEIDNKISELQSNIQQVRECISKEKEVDNKLASLTLGNLFLRLAQCKEEEFSDARSIYQKAAACFGEIISPSGSDEIDLLLMLCKGKYFRNTARIGRKSAYDKALDIFSEVVKAVIIVRLQLRREYIYIWMP